MDSPRIAHQGGAHRSAPVDLDLAPLVIGQDRLQVARAYLWQGDGPTGAPFLVLESGSGSLSLPVLKAAGVLIQLALLVGKGAPA
ncbi:MAG: hypothetical protein ABW156_11855 [Jiangellaceae bacterium]